MSDLSDLIRRPPPAGPGQAVEYRQGTVLTFNQVTLANTVDVGGTVMTDLPILGVGESMLLVPGSVVGILAVGGATKTYCIVGRLVTPGTTAAANAISLESARTSAATVDAVESTSSTTYGNLATVGPSVTVTVGPSKRLLISLSYGLSWDGTSGGGGSASVAMSGANSLDPNTGDVPLVSGFSLSGLGAQNPAYTWVMDVANTGSTTITAKYANLIIGSNATFGPRTLVVQAL